MANLSEKSQYWKPHYIYSWSGSVCPYERSDLVNYKSYNIGISAEIKIKPKTTRNCGHHMPKGSEKEMRKWENVKWLTSPTGFKIDYKIIGNWLAAYSKRDPSTRVKTERKCGFAKKKLFLKTPKPKSKEINFTTLHREKQERSL